MNRRQFLFSLSSTSLLTNNVFATPTLAPIYSLLLNDESPLSLESWFDSVGLLPIGDNVFTVTSRSQQIFVDGNATIQGNGTQASPYKDFYFLGGRNADGNRVKSRIVIDPSDTVIYVRGTFRLSDHQQDINGSSMRIQLSNKQMLSANGGHNPFNADKPLIFAPWPNQAGPVFDAQNGTYPESGSGNGDDCPIHAFGGTSDSEGYTDVEFRGFTIKNGRCKALMRFHQGCRTARLISCHVHDGQPQSSSPAQSGGIMFEMSKVNANHLVDHCEVHNNAANVTNNVGEISWLSDIQVTNTADNQLMIQNSIVHNSYRAFTGKKSGNSTVIIRNNYVYNLASQALYARGGLMQLEYNIFKNTNGLCQPDYQNLKAPKHITIDHNTVIDCGAVIATTTDSPELTFKEATSVTITDNAFIDSTFNKTALLFQALYNDGITQLPDVIRSANNRFGLPNASPAFLQRKKLPDLTFNQSRTIMNDTGSLLEAVS